MLESFAEHIGDIGHIDESIRVQYLDVAQQHRDVAPPGDDQQDVFLRLGEPALGVQEGDAAFEIIGDGIGDFLVFFGTDIFVVSISNFMVEQILYMNIPA